MTGARHGQRWAAPEVAAAHGIQHSERIHWLRTLLAKQHRTLQREHLRFKPQTAAAGTLHCALVDCSASMLAGQGLAQAKGMLMQLIHAAYRQRGEVAIIRFAGQQAQVVLPPTLARPITSVGLTKWLELIRGGGGTPFAKGVAAADLLLAKSARAKPAQQRWLWLLTDGRSREVPAKPRAADTCIIVDCEHHRAPLGRCSLLAQRWQASYLSIDSFTAPLAEEITS